MTSRKIWNPKLFFEGMKQLKLIGFLSIIVMCLEAVIIPVSHVMSSSNLNITGAEVVSAIGAHPFLILTYTVIAPLMTLSVFSFQNKRTASDFYHSLPYTRVCLFLSYASAVFVWLIGVIILSTGLSIVTHLILASRLTLLVTSLVKLALGCLVASLLVSASVMLAMSVTGTIFTNIVVSGLIIFLPRFSILLITSAIASALPILDMTHLPFLLDNSLNIAAGSVMGVFTNRIGMTSGLLGVLTGAASQIYSAVLAVILLVLACLLFCKRKSETAERSAPNRVLQAVFRITLTMVVCLPVCTSIFNDSVYGGRSDAFVYVVYFLIAASVYFAYELITSKQISKAVKSLPGLLIVALLCLGLILGMKGIYKAELNFTPSEEEIKGVCLTESDARARYFVNLYEYAVIKNSSTELDDAETREIVSRTLSESCELIKGGNTDAFYSSSYGIPQTFRIRTSSGTKYRTLILSENDYEKLFDNLTARENFSKSLTELPTPIKNTLSWGEPNLGAEESNALFESLRKETAKADTSEWFDAVTKMNVPTVALLQYVIELDGTSPTLEVPVCPEFAPETCRRYLDIMAKNSNINPDELTDLLRKSEEEGQRTLSGSVFLGSITVYVCGKDGKLTSYYWYPDGLVTSDEIGEILSGALEIRAPAAGESFITASFNCFNAGNQREYKTIAGTLRDDAAEKIADLLRKLEE